MRSFPPAALMVGALLLLPAAAPALTVKITGFENGGDIIPSGADVSGDTFRRRSVLGITPTEGTRQFIAGTRDNPAEAAGVVESDLGLPGGTLDAIFASDVPSTGSGPTEGGAFRIVFAAEAGDTLIFDWNFVTAENHPEALYTDYAFAHLALGGTTVDQRALGHANQAGFLPTNNASYDQTGYQTEFISIGATGTYTVTVGVMDVQDTFVDSFAIFDFFRLRKAPEPATGALMLLGLAGLGWHGRRRH